MRFHLDHTPAQPGFDISHKDRIFLIGSCFSENMGKLLGEHKFTICSNPSGILFNPLSIHRCFQALIAGENINEPFILQRNALFLSYLHHSSIHGHTKDALLQTITADAKKAAAFLKEAGFLVITFGTAYAYRHLQLNTVVANCHKQAAGAFEKKLTEPEQIVDLYKDLLAQLKTFNPKLRIIFTVSPVKYLKDGLVENTLSKSILHLSVQRIVQQHDHCFYFPAYELVNDDLRDYRFYKQDLAHPNEQAIDYVCQKFSVSFFNKATLTLNQKIHQLNLALKHQTMSADPVEAARLQDFISRQKEAVERDLQELSS